MFGVQYQSKVDKFDLIWSSLWLCFQLADFDPIWKLMETMALKNLKLQYKIA